MLDIGYAYYVVALLVLTGILILILDVTTYKKSNMHKEKKYAIRLAWTNIIMGACLFVSWWSYQKYK